MCFSTGCPCEPPDRPRVSVQRSRGGWQQSPRWAVSLQSPSGRKGQGSKHARRPFSAIRRSLTLRLDGFASSRGALQDPHQGSARNTKNPAAVGRRRPAAHHENAPSVKERGETPQAKGTPTRYMQMHYLSAFFRFDPPIYRRRPYGVAPFCGCSRLTEIWNNSWKSTKLQGLQPRLRPASRRAEFP